MRDTSPDLDGRLSFNQKFTCLSLISNSNRPTVHRATRHPPNTSGGSMRFPRPFRSARPLPILIGILLTAVGGTCLAQNTCQLKSPSGRIKHVIYVQFDNTHFLRDNPNVPSDLEQMPHLLNFIKDNGTLLANDHTALISHTATGILTSLTGVYPDRMGQPVSNSFRYFTTTGTTRTGVSFAYWTAPLFDPAGPPFPPAGQTDLTPTMINEKGKVAPAP